MQAITTIGLDIAKSDFQVHCIDAEGQVVIRRQLKQRDEYDCGLTCPKSGAKRTFVRRPNRHE